MSNINLFLIVLEARILRSVFQHGESWQEPSSGLYTGLLLISSNGRKMGEKYLGSLYKGTNLIY